MKKVFLGLIVFFCLCITAYKVFFYFDHQSEQRAVKKNKAVTRLSPSELNLIHEGDFILRRGFGFFSDYISKNLNDGAIDVTHAGIIIKENDSLFVIHSLSSDVSEIDGIQKQPLSDFLVYSAPNKIIITRVKNSDSICGSTIAKQAKVYLKQHIPFDHSGVYDDTNELFCTELIWQILEKDMQRVTLPANPEKRKAFFYSMTPMYDTDYFDIIINQYQTDNPQ